jgi:hypothetical protein
LIDVIAEAGPYPPGETDLRKFIVEGEKRYWLHIAIGRRRDKRDNGSTRWRDYSLALRCEVRWYCSVPRKIWQLIADLEKHGFVDRGAKDHIETSSIKITLSGAPGDDAKHYQERDLKRAIQKVQSWARHLIATWKLLPGVKKTSATLADAPALCWAECMGATNAQCTQSCVKRLMNGFDCTKRKAGRFPDRPLFAKSKRLSDFIVEGEQHYWVHVGIERFTNQVIDKQIEVVNE